MESRERRPWGSAVAVEWRMKRVSRAAWVKGLYCGAEKKEVEWCC